MSLKPDGPVPTKEEFLKVVREGRRSKGMPDFPADYLSDDRLDAIYAYVKGRSDDVIKPGRPVRRPE
jgi:mono/diheme cytochrome c family protein